jgi:hypothetical protein
MFICFDVKYRLTRFLFLRFSSKDIPILLPASFADSIKNTLIISPAVLVSVFVTCMPLLLRFYFDPPPAVTHPPFLREGLIRYAIAQYLDS